MLQQMDLDTALLDLVQEEIPLCRRPFAELACRLDVDEAMVLERLWALHDGPAAPIRQMSAIFDSKSLGYESTLVAAKVEESRIAEAAAIISRHPGVSHNYRRDHAYNLWYTLAVPPDTRLGLNKTIEILHRQSGSLATRILPTLKMYKIGVKFDLGSSAGRSRTSVAPRHRPAPLSLTEPYKRMIRALQRDLPIVSAPFDDLARLAEVSVEELLTTADLFLRRGLMRRFSAVLRHRELGFDANAMGVWPVPAAQQDAFGEAAARFPEVSHCYLRPAYVDWPYTIFTMIHAKDREQAGAILNGISDATGMKDYSVLYSTEEFKKVRVRYFEADIAGWEAENS